MDLQEKAATGGKITLHMLRALLQGLFWQAPDTEKSSRLRFRSLFPRHLLGGSPLLEGAFGPLAGFPLPRLFHRKHLFPAQTDVTFKEQALGGMGSVWGGGGRAGEGGSKRFPTGRPCSI